MIAAAADRTEVAATLPAPPIRYIRCHPYLNYAAASAYHCHGETFCCYSIVAPCDISHRLKGDLMNSDHAVDMSENYFYAPSARDGGTTVGFAGSRRLDDGSVDFGLFGPDSVVWEVLTPLPVSLIIDIPVAAFEAWHRGMTTIEFGHDPLINPDARAKLHRRFGRSAGQPRSPREGLDRHIRTALVPTVIIMGDTPTAEHAARRLHNYHKPMTAVTPGYAATPENTYNAASVQMMLFAYVTIFDASLRQYEHLIIKRRGGLRRLPEAKRNQYWQEMVPFARLMGIPDDQIPTSSVQVDQYYRDIEDQSLHLPRVRAALRSSRDALPLAASILKPRNWPDSFRAALLAGVVAPGALAVLPRQLRRYYRIPKLLDPFIDLLRYPTAVALWPLQMPIIAEATAQFIFNPDAKQAMRHLREVKSQCTAMSAEGSPMVAQQGETE